MVCPCPYCQFEDDKSDYDYDYNPPILSQVYCYACNIPFMIITNIFFRGTYKRIVETTISFPCLED